ncbi:putative ribonuclease H-like domain-containing protein [Tanacetum coccineum]|uniref:Ribonuclease H-like domain-containing protein n=1 Tax=Tanacetum coccineum TaxID=301880 RepID=A0ABQ5BBT4_9ASTR
MNYQPITAENQTNKNAGPQETNGNTGLKKNVDVGQTKEENVSTQQYIVFPLWSSISSNYKSSDDKAEDDTVDDDACKKTVQEPTSEYDQSLKNVLDKMMDQEKEAAEQLDAEDTVEIQSTGIFGNAYDDHNLETLNTPYADQSVGAEADFNNMEHSTIVSPIPTTRLHSIHPKAQIIRDPNSRFKRFWTLVDLPSGKKAIGTKWVYRNKKDEKGIVVRNKARLVAQGYKQEERIDCDEVFAPVARVEAIRLFLAFASFMNFHVYQMDVKSAFLYGTIEEEISDNTHLEEKCVDVRE